ncbi:MAG: sugar-binding protein [Lentisphaerota bacterium]
MPIQAKIVLFFVLLMTGLSNMGIAGGKCAILLPENRPGQEAPAKIYEQAAAFKNFLLANKLEADLITDAAIDSGKADFGKYQTVFIWCLFPWPEAMWSKAEKYVRSGGNLFWQGNALRGARLTDEYLNKLQALAGVKFGEYQSDPLVGKGVINRFMWIRTLKSPAPPALLWQGEEPEMFASFSGEAFKLEAVDGGVAVAEWIQRDRKTGDGVAAVVKCYPGNGRTVFLSSYSFIMAGLKSEELSSQHSRKMLKEYLKFLEPAPAHAAKARQEPVNLREINPDYSCPRAMWIWNIDFGLDDKESDQLIKFCGLKKINVLYFYTGRAAMFTEEQSLQKLKRFLRKAHAAGIKVQGLDGWNDAFLPEKQPGFLAAIQRILDYNKQAAEDERFDGFQSDVEPVTFKGYHQSPENKKRIDLQFIELHVKGRDLITQSGLKNFEYGLAILESHDKDKPETYITWNGRTGNVAEHAIDIFDYFAIMSYHDLARVTIKSAQYNVDLAAAKGKKALVGAETLDFFTKYQGSREITFYEEGVDEMEKELKKVYNHFKDNNGFGGFAIHHYDSYRTLPDKPRRIASIAAPELKAEKLENPEAGKIVWRKQYPQLMNRREQVIHSVKDWKGPQDLSAAVWFGYTPDALYLRAEIKDDVILTQETGRDMWKRDHVELWINNPGEEDSFQAGMTPAEFDKPLNNAYVWLPAGLPEEERAKLAAQITYKFEKNGDGYILECKVPYTAFGTGYDAVVKNGLNVLFEVGDSDNMNHAPKTQISNAPGKSRGKAGTYSRLVLTKE